MATFIKDCNEKNHNKSLDNIIKGCEAKGYVEITLISQQIYK